jgi:hypothetical protein
MKAVINAETVLQQAEKIELCLPAIRFIRILCLLSWKTNGGNPIFPFLTQDR